MNASAGKALQPSQQQFATRAVERKPITLIVRLAADIPAHLGFCPKSCRYRRVSNDKSRLSTRMANKSLPSARRVTCETDGQEFHRSVRGLRLPVQPPLPRPLLPLLPIPLWASTREIHPHKRARKREAGFAPRFSPPRHARQCTTGSACDPILRADHANKSANVAVPTNGRTRKITMAPIKMYFKLAALLCFFMFWPMLTAALPCSYGLASVQLVPSFDITAPA